MRGGVFICHSSVDAAVAERVVEVLEAAGIGCWIAPRDIQTGEDWPPAILDGIDAAPALILLFSVAANESRHVSREVGAAVKANKRLIPVRLEAVQPSGTLDYYIDTAQWLDTVGSPPQVWEPVLVRDVGAILRGSAPRAASAPGAQVEPAQPVADRGAAERTRLQQAVDAGDTDAMTRLGLLHVEAGEIDKAGLLFDVAAHEGGGIDAIQLAALLPTPARRSAKVRDQAFALGIAYGAMGGVGVPNIADDPARQSVTYLHEAADAGHAGAMHLLGLLDEEAGDSEAARTWFERAAAAGSTSATYALGVLHQRSADPAV